LNRKFEERTHADYQAVGVEEGTSVVARTREKAGPAAEHAVVRHPGNKHSTGENTPTNTGPARRKLKEFVQIRDKANANLDDVRKPEAEVLYERLTQSQLVPLNELLKKEYEDLLNQLRSELEHEKALGVWVPL
jgi:hypothetical protein